MSDGELIEVVLEHEPGPPERVVLRGAFRAGPARPPGLADDPPPGVTRNVAFCRLGCVVDVSVFRAVQRNVTTQPPPPAPRGDLYGDVT